MFVPFQQLGVRWSLVATPDIGATFGKQYIAVIADAVVRDVPIPELVPVGDLLRVHALVPMTPRGADTTRMIMTD